MKKNKVQALVVFFFVLVLPVIFIFVLRSSDNVYLEPPILGPKEVTEEGDTTYHKIRNFKLIEPGRNGLFRAKEALNGKIYLAYFFYTECPEECQDLTRIAKKIQEETVDIPNFEIVAITVDSKTDQPKVLQKYADSMEIDQSNFHLLTGHIDRIEQIAEEDFLIPHESKRHGKFPRFNSDLLFIVDQENRIRSMRKAGEDRIVKKLTEEIIVLSVKKES